MHYQTLGCISVPVDEVSSFSTSEFKTDSGFEFSSEVIFYDFRTFLDQGLDEYKIMVTLYERYGELGLYFGCGCFDVIHGKED